MAKGTTDFARQTTEQTAQTTDWIRAIAEQNLNQSKAAQCFDLAVAHELNLMGNELTAKGRELWSQERKAWQTQKLVDPRSDDKVATH
jgi:hypothetical protein